MIKRAKIQSKCVECESVFYKKTNNQIVCSKNCRLKRRVKLEKPKNWAKRGYEGYGEKECKICLTVFKPVTSTHLTCSDECSLVQKRRIKNEAQKQYHKKRKSDPQYKAKVLARNSIRKMILHNNNRSNVFADYGRERFIEHIESQFRDGMTWENYGEWEIDHIISLNKFNFVTSDGSINEDELIRANSLGNLQPLWRIENRRKANTDDI